eukprot:CAMPEP_0168517766 /NCGR_PEP_ID=MMETSP0405-20121227/6273_1 /TAXON_ID=498012 /ORGANISM="Trichosphaerium sp, Strain Am-I-7 wt" /LENGTH=133 /DNA_ID=CAMNT_0008537891 /DNA_START=50 /DNA_END=451 /DNA_ORIENTATION=+
MSMPQTEAEWKAKLTPEQFRVLRQKGTERPGTGEYNHHKAKGTYVCAGCGAELYKSEHKFDSGCGWPAFYDSIGGKNAAVARNVDTSHGMRRVEIVCSKCQGHLGHVFSGEGYNHPTDERHCVNSASLRFNPN